MRSIESDAMVYRIRSHSDEHGWGLRAVEVPGVADQVPHNRRSRRVMEKIGMSHDEAGDFDHPLLPSGHPLERHVLYRLGREEWQASRV